MLIITVFDVVQVASITLITCIVDRTWQRQKNGSSTAITERYICRLGLKRRDTDGPPRFVTLRFDTISWVDIVEL